MRNMDPFKTRLSGKEKALLKAAKEGNTKKVAELIGNGVDVNCGGTWQDHSNVTALMYAAEAGHRRIVQLLVKAGADIHARDKSAAMRGGEATALHYALRLYETGEPNRDVVQDLLRAGADPNARLANGKTALEFASGCGFLEAVRLLLKYGGNPNRPIGPEDMGPALCNAAMEGFLPVVKLLLKSGADPNGADYDAFTPLMAAASCISDESGANHNEIVRLLLRVGAKGNIVDKKGRTALMFAVDRAACSVTKEFFRYCFKVVRTLIEFGKADLNIKDAENKTTLDYASVSDYPELPDYLRKHGARSGADLKVCERVDGH